MLFLIQLTIRTLSHVGTMPYLCNLWVSYFSTKHDAEKLTCFIAILVQNSTLANVHNNMVSLPFPAQAPRTKGS